MTIILPNGYKMQTTFFQDFAIADKFGIKAIDETFNISFNNYKDNLIYITELAIVMSNKSCEWYGRDEERMQRYADYYHHVDEWCMKRFKGAELKFYLDTTD